MTIFLLLWMTFFQSGPTQTQDPNYPIRVQILERNVERHSHDGMITTRMWGRADITAPTPEGIDFDSDCGEVFMISHGDERYSARWKKPNLQLEMLVSKIGTGKSSKCTLKVDPKQFLYVVNSKGKIVTRPLPTAPAPAGGGR